MKAFVISDYDTVRKKNKAKRSFFWMITKLMPQSLRAEIVRSKFEVSYDLPKELVFKIADEEAEIKEALQLAHDSYVELNYMDAHETKLRYTKFHAHPGSMILVAKWEEEVIGTLTIIPDSAFGLLSDTTWDLKKYRKNGLKIAEISSLVIKKNFRMSRGKLLLPLCKIMYQVCKDYLKLDGVIAATTHEVEPFYTDVLLFEKVCNDSKKDHSLVKGNSSRCCFLPMDSKNESRGKKIYSNKPISKNLYKFFIESSLSNISLPKEKKCLQSYMVQQNVAKSNLLKSHKSIFSNFSEKDEFILKNYDLRGDFNSHLESHNIDPKFTKYRFVVQETAWFFGNESDISKSCHIVNASREGFCLSLRGQKDLASLDDEIIIVCKISDKIIQLRGKVKWAKDSLLGCELTEFPEEWNRYINQLSFEIDIHDSVALSPQVA